MRNGPLVEAQNLYKHYPLGKSLLFHHREFIHAVDGVTLEIHRNETLGLVGESGCGKSTLGRLILGLEEPTSGTIAFEGKCLHKQKKSEIRKLRSQMQIIFQDPYSSLNPRKTAGTIIGQPFVVHGLGNDQERLKWVMELLEVVGLRPEHYHRYPHEFSGGQRQRIGIARALALKPKLIIADEPVASLDVSIQGQIINLLRDLQDRYQLTYLFISHDLSVVKHISNRVAVMYLGKLVELGNSQSLFKNPQHPYTKALLSVIPQVTGGKKRKRILIEGEISSPINPPPGCRFWPRCPHAMAVCKTTEPVLEEVESFHRVACHLC
jgi:oligopeptide/dipeptide ABC transporter ATP-binding protein